MKLFSRFLKLIVIISAIVGTYLSFMAGRNTFMSGAETFMYFTTQSNIAIALICAVGLVLMSKDRPIPNAWYVVKFVGTVSITLTGVVFATMLAPLLGEKAWILRNTLTHVIVPVAAVLDFFLVSRTTDISKKSVIDVIIPPLLYAVYAGIGDANNWQFASGYNYPYFFLNWGSEAGAFGFVNGFPFMGTFWWILLLFIFLLILGYVYLKLVDLIKKRNGGKEL